MNSLLSFSIQDEHADTLEHLKTIVLKNAKIIKEDTFYFHLQTTNWRLLVENVCTSLRTDTIIQEKVKWTISLLKDDKSLIFKPVKQAD